MIVNAPVAQLDRASASGAEGCRFEPCRAHTFSGIAALAAAAILVAHAWAYFFLLDDFIITAQVSSKTVWQLLTEPQFNFFRPVSDLWLKALFAMFRWNVPAAYIAMSLAVHAANTLLVRVLARMCGLAPAPATAAAALFFLSPWATEPILWVAASCDSLPTLGLLGSLVAGLALVPPAVDEHNAAPARPIPLTAFLLGVLSAVEAVLAKETGVLSPALVILAIACLRGPRALREPRAALYVLSLAVIACAYLAFRQSILPGLGGGYGTIRTLFAQSSIAHNLFAFARALLLPPLPDLVPGAAGILLRIVGGLFAAGLVALIVSGAVSRWRVAALCGAAVLTCLAPVLWATLAPGNTSGNRFLYLPGVWIAMLAAAGTERRGRIVLPLIFAIALGSLFHQARIWRDAFELSRATIAQLRPYERSSGPLFITNLPGRFADGPYVLNPVALTAAFDGTLPPVEANEMGLKFIGGETTFSFWLGEHRDARADERGVTLDLPVWTGESRPFGAIEAPGPGAEVAQPFTVSGWTIDAGAREGTGVDAVRVYARPLASPAQEEAPLGSARYGDRRPDVSERFGERFLNSGFTREVSGLSPGRYRILVYTRRALARGADVPLSVDVVVR